MTIRNDMFKNFLILVATLFLVVARGFPACAEWEAGSAVEEEEVFFMAIPVVTIAAKKEQNLLDAAAAVHVITREDIRRSGVTSIPEALRMVPGINVARINASKWAISSRGFNGVYSKKLLVLMDGRTVYTPFFGGVYWDVQDTVLEDIDRIEVVHGPGGTLWGSNAVNGVINIITKNAKDTQGALASAGGGNQERGFGTLRYGARLSENAYLRLYAKYFYRDDFVDEKGTDIGDQWDMGRGGFRMDWEKSDRDAFTIQGDLYDGETGESLTIPDEASWSMFPIRDTADLDGGNILARWKHTFSDSSDLSLQLYYDRIQRTTLVCGEKRDTYDIDFQHRFPVAGRQEIIWGLGYRFTRDHTEETFVVSLDPDKRSDETRSAFIQDEITLVNGRLALTVGSKFEDNDYTGLEIQPSARLLWKPTARRSLWAAVSRAVRVPSRSHSDIRMNFAVFENEGTRFLLSAFGNDDYDSEKVIAYELGYRCEPAEGLSVDIALFYNDYSDLFTTETVRPAFFEAGHLVLPRDFDNEMEGATFGGEVTVKWKVLEDWTLLAGCSLLEMNLDASGTDSARPDKEEGRNPEGQFFVRSLLGLPCGMEFDTALYHVDGFSYFESEHDNLDIPGYNRLDIRLGWKPLDSLEISLAAQNLLDDQHPEYTAAEAGINPSEVPRSFYAKLTWKF